MQRDMDLVRDILLEIEKNQNPMRDIKLQAHGYSPEQAAYHVKLLAEAGYLEAVDFSSMSGMEWRPKSMTWKGHEFLDATRNEGVWHKLKAELKDRSMTLPFALIQELAIKLAAKAAGL